jgi:hypothetical protein
MPVGPLTSMERGLPSEVATQTPEPLVAAWGFFIGLQGSYRVLRQGQPLAGKPPVGGFQGTVAANFIFS